MDHASGAGRDAPAPREGSCGFIWIAVITKEELVAAAIDAYAQDNRAALASLGRHRTPHARLKAFVRLVMERSDLAARYGCPEGSLCSELEEQDDGLGRACAELMRLPIDRAEEQFKAMGRRDARDLAVALVASYEGSRCSPTPSAIPN